MKLIVVWLATFFVAFAIVVGTNTRIWAQQEDLSAASQKLAPFTVQKLQALPETQSEPIEIRCYFSPTAPSRFAKAIKDARELVAEFDRLGEEKIEVMVTEVESYSEAAVNAHLNEQIVPYSIGLTVGGIWQGTHVFNTLIVEQGEKRIALGSLPGNRLEYDLLRAIQNVISLPKPKLGVLETGFAYGETNQTISESTAIELLRQRYDVVSISAGEQPPEDLSVLIVGQAQHLRATQLDQVMNLIKSGIPTLVLADPGRPMPPNEESGPANLEPLWDLLGVSVDEGTVVWQAEPELELRNDVPPWCLVVDASQKESQLPVLEGISRLCFFAAGNLNIAEQSDWVSALVGTGTDSGKMSIFDSQASQKKTPTKHIVAAEVRKATAEGSKRPIHSIVITDTDFLQFQLPNSSNDPVLTSINENDNLNFFENCIDHLANVKGWQTLRTRSISDLPLSETEETLQDISRDLMEAMNARIDDYQESQRQKMLAFQERLEAASEADPTSIPRLQTEYRQRLEKASEAVNQFEKQLVDETQQKFTEATLRYPHVLVPIK